jgi:hypothetical protein
MAGEDRDDQPLPRQDQEEAMKIRRTAALVALAAFIAASIAAVGPASAAAGSAALKLTKRDYGHWSSPSQSICNWTITGKTSVYRPGSRVSARLVGDDTWSDDLLTGRVAVRNYDGQNFYDWYGIDCSALNEDLLDWDEIYATILVYNSAGTKVEEFTTNMVWLTWWW